MVWMINKDTGQPTDFANEDVKEALRLGIAEFVEEKVPVKYYKKLQDGTRDPEDEVGIIKKYPRSEATARLIEDKDSHFVAPEEAYDHWVDRKYGSGYEGAALGLGLADMVTVSGASAVGELMGLPTREIRQANPWLHAIGDIGTTVGLLGASAISGGTAAPLTVPLLSKEGAKWAARFGIKKAASAAKYTAPFWIQEAGKKVAGSKVREGIAKKLLGDVADRSLNQHAAEGLFARTAALGVESMLYAGGYSASDNLAELVHGNPDKAIENMAHGFGLGSILGMALPVAFHGVKVAGAGAIDLSRRGIKGSLDYMKNRKGTDNFLRSIAEEADELGVIQGEITRDELGDRLVAAKAGKEARVAQQGLVDNFRGVQTATAQVVDDSLGLHRDIRAIDQAGHTGQALDNALLEIFPGQEGAASSSVLAYQLFAGVTDEQGVNRGGLIDILGSTIDEFMGKSGVKKYTPLKAGRGVQSGQQLLMPPDIPQSIKQELRHIRGQIAELQTYSRNWMLRKVRLLTDNELPLENMPDWLRSLHSSNIRENPERLAELTKILAKEPMFAGELDQEFNARVFSLLEKLSARVHTGILEKRFGAEQQDFVNAFKEELTSFLTSTNTWKHGKEFGGLTPWGALATQKLKLNKLLNNRDADYLAVRDLFAVVDPTDRGTKYAGKYIADDAAIEKFIRGLNKDNADHSLTTLKTYSEHSSELLDYLSKNYNGNAKQFKAVRAAAEHAKLSKDQIEKTLSFLKDDMEPALRYADMLKKEHRDMNMQHFGKAAIPGSMAALLGTAAGIASGNPLLGITAAMAPGVARTRLAMTPMNSVIRVNRMFSNIEKRDESVKRFVSDYIRSFGKAKFPDEGFARWPRIFTTNAITRSQRKEGDYRHSVGSNPKNTYGPAEMKNTREAINALAQSPALKEKLVNEVLAGVETYAPYVAPLLRKKIDEYVNAVSKALPPTISYDMFSEDIEPSDTEIQEFAEKLSVYENGPDAIFRSLAMGTLTDNEWEALQDMYPSTAASIAQHTLESMGNVADFKKKAPESLKSQLAIIIDFQRFNSQTQQVLRGTFAPKEEGKPGPKPQAKWAGDTSQIAQLSGTRAIEGRRS